MKIRKTLVSIVLSTILTLGLTNKVNASSKSQTNPLNENLKIANWNLQIFGKTKASNNELIQIYASIIDGYDIIFIQEIRDKSQKAFPKLCSLLPNYNCIASSRAGRTASREQYGVIYKKDIELTNFKDFNPDPLDRWERPPIEVTFNIKGYKLITYNIHTKPDDAPREIDYLEDIVKTKGNVIVLGDLNADCSYYNPLIEDDFGSWTWIIGDEEDTTASSTNCAYDRIILNDDVYEEYVNDEIYKQITKNISDHYLVWVELQSHFPTDLNKDGITNFKDYAIFTNNWYKVSNQNNQNAPVGDIDKNNFINLEYLTIFIDYWLYKP